MDNLENIQSQPEFDPIAESADFMPDAPAHEESPEVEAPEMVEEQPELMEEILPEEKPKKKKKGGKLFFMALSCLLALAIVIAGGVGTAIWLQFTWAMRSSAMSRPSIRCSRPLISSVRRLRTILSPAMAILFPAHPMKIMAV